MTKDGKPTNTKIVVVESDQEMKQFLNSPKNSNENIEIFSKEMLEDFRDSFQSMLEGKEPHYVHKVLLANIDNIDPDSMRKLCKIVLDHRQVQDSNNFLELYNFVKFLQTKNSDPDFQKAINTAINESLGLLLEQKNIRNEFLEVILSDKFELSEKNLFLLNDYRGELEKLNDGSKFHWLIYKAILVDNKIDDQDMSTKTRGDDRINTLNQYQAQLLNELLDNMRSPEEEPFVRFILGKLANHQVAKQLQEDKAISKDFERLNKNILNEMSKFNFGKDEDRKKFADTILNNFQIQYPNLAKKVTANKDIEILKQNLCDKLQQKEEEFKKSHWKITRVILDLLGIKKQTILKALSKDVISQISPVVPRNTPNQGKNTPVRSR